MTSTTTYSLADKVLDYAGEHPSATAREIMTGLGIGYEEVTLVTFEHWLMCSRPVSVANAAPYAAPWTPDEVKEGEWKVLTRDQLGRVTGRSGPIIGDVPLSCEFCDEPAVWTTGDHSPRVACYDLRHIAGAMSIGSGVEPMWLLHGLAAGEGGGSCFVCGNAHTNDVCGSEGCICAELRLP